MTMAIRNEIAAPAGDLVWGAKAIAALIGRPEKAVFGMLESGRVPGAKKIAGRWCLRPSIFFAAFETTAEKPARVSVIA